jgi:hypothetical protein
MPELLLPEIPSGCSGYLGAGLFAYRPKTGKTLSNLTIAGVEFDFPNIGIVGAVSLNCPVLPAQAAESLQPEQPVKSVKAV